MSNADIAWTAAHVLGLTLPSKGRLQGRLLWEALEARPGKPVFAGSRRTQVSAANADGKATVLQFQQIDGRRYFDAACRRLRSFRATKQAASK